MRLSNSASESLSPDRLSDFPSTDRRMFYISALAVGIGVGAAFIAAALLDLIGLFTNLFFFGKVSTALTSPALNTLGYVEVAVPALGGLVVGLMARYGSERIRGHGIPEALEAILINKSRIEPRVTILKPLSTAVSIGSGGPFGAEGPIIMTGGSFGSVLGQMLKLAATERRTLLVAGAAAGMAATFNAPVAAALLAVELLLFEWKPRSLIPVGLASLSATVVRWSIIGANPLFPIASTPMPDWSVMVSACFIGLVAGIGSTLLTYAVYASEDAFKRLPIHWMWWPVIGGAVIGVGGLLAPRALGVGYDTIDLLLLGKLAFDTAAVLMIVKAVIWSVSLGSGTSGGVLAPLLLIGGSLGTLEASFLSPNAAPLWVAVSMGAMLGGTMRSPFTGAVFALELTRDVNALAPLLAGAFVADFVTVFTMRRSILTEKVARRGIHLSREYGVDVLEQVPVRVAMEKAFETVPGVMPVEALIEKFRVSQAKPTGYPVLDAEGWMVGYFSRANLEKLSMSTVGHGMAAEDMTSPPRVFALPWEPSRIAADRLAGEDLDSMPVVDPANTRKVVGLISREDIFRARVAWFKEESTRERHLSVATWLSGLGSNKKQSGQSDR